MEELSSTMMMPTASIRRKMALWQSHGLLREESADVFVLVEEAKGKGDEVVTVEEDEAESAMASASDQRAEEMQVGVLCLYHCGLNKRAAILQMTFLYFLYENWCIVFLFFF